MSAESVTTEAVGAWPLRPERRRRAQSRRISLARGNGRTTTYAYTNASRLAALNQGALDGVNNANWAYTYTPAGQLATRTLINAYEWGVPALEDAYQRNGLNQYTAVDGTAISYDPRGNLTNDGARRFCYDLENRLIGEAAIFTGANLIADYAYDAQSRRISLARGPNQPTTTYTYTQASRLAGLNHDLLGGPDANWAYTYTPAGQLASRALVSAYEWGAEVVSSAAA